MAKVTKMQATRDAMAAKRAELDKDILEFMAINAERKALAKKEAALKAKIEGNYVLDASIKEVLRGVEMYAEKVPSRRNITWDQEAITTLVQAAIQAGADVELANVVSTRTVVDVNTDQLKRLVKGDYVPQEAVDKCFTCDYTFSSKFGRVEDLNG